MLAHRHLSALRVNLRPRLWFLLPEPELALELHQFSKPSFVLPQGITTISQPPKRYKMRPMHLDSRV